MRWPVSPRFQPRAELTQRAEVHLLQLVQQHEAALRFQTAHNGGRHPQLLTAGHIIPFLTVIGQCAVRNTEALHRQLGAVEQRALVLAKLFNFGGQAVVLLLIGACIFFGLFTVEVVAHLGVDGFDVGNAAFQLLGALVHQLLGGLACGGKVSRLGGEFVLGGLQLTVQLIHTRGEGAHLLLEQACHRPLALVLAVAGKDCLLLTNEVTCGDEFVRCIRPVRLLFRVFGFLVGNAANGKALVVLLLLFALECGKLFAHADDAEQRVRLFTVARLHKAWQIECQLPDKGVQQLLSGLAARRVDDLEVAVLAAALDDQAVGQRDLDVRRDGAALTGSHGRTEAVAAERPCDRVQQ